MAIEYTKALGLASEAIQKTIKVRLYITVFLVLYTFGTIILYFVLQAKNSSAVGVKTNTNGNGNVVVAQTSYTNAAIEYSKSILIGQESILRIIFRLFSATAWLSIALCVVSWLEVYVCNSCPMKPKR